MYAGTRLFYAYNVAGSGDGRRGEPGVHQERLRPCCLYTDNVVGSRNVETSTAAVKNSYNAPPLHRHRPWIGNVEASTDAVDSDSVAT
jgi:hypothetical protein